MVYYTSLVGSSIPAGGGNSPDAPGAPPVVAGGGGDDGGGDDKDQCCSCGKIFVTYDDDFFCPALNSNSLMNAEVCNHFVCKHYGIIYHILYGKSLKLIVKITIFCTCTELRVCTNLTPQFVRLRN